MLGAVNSKVHTLTGLRAGRYGVRIPTATRDSCLVQKSRPSLDPSSPAIRRVPGRFPCG
jgi:hypothetical protein